MFLAPSLSPSSACWYVCPRVPGASVRVPTVAGLLSVAPSFQGSPGITTRSSRLLALNLPARPSPSRIAGRMLAVGGVSLSGVNQQIVDRWLAARGREVLLMVAN